MQDLREETGFLVCDFKLKEYQLSKTLELYKFWGVLSDIVLAIISFSSIGAWALWKNDLKWLWATILFIVQCISIGKPYLNASNTMSCLDEKCKQAKILVSDAKSLYRDLSDMQGTKYTDSQKEDYKRLELEGLKVFDFDSNTFVFKFFGYPNKWAQKQMRSWAETTLNFKF